MEFNQDSILNALSLMSSWEITAALLGVVYVILAAKESLWTWVFGFFSTLIYTVIFWEGALVSSSLLNFYYMIMAVYGFYAWRKGKANETLKITSYSLVKNLKFIIIGVLFSIIIGYLSSTYTVAKLAYMDSFVLVFSVLATWMLTQKILENWLYWLIVDSVAIVLYWNTGYLATVILFVVYIVLGIYAYLTWKKEFKT
jgi:nicotinamide mononucleotide transporter